MSYKKREREKVRNLSNLDSITQTGGNNAKTEAQGNLYLVYLL